MQELKYKQVDDGTFCVSGYEGDEAVVEIPAALDGVPVTIVGDSVFQGHDEITEIRFPEGITDLGEFVFDGCENLRRLELPAKLERLWGCTFVRCGLEEIRLPDGVRSIPPYCFKDCKSLQRVICGAGLRSVHAWAFGGCDKLSALDCGPKVQIHPMAFSKRDASASEPAANET